MTKTPGRQLLEALIRDDEAEARALFSAAMRRAALKTLGVREASEAPAWMEEALGLLRTKFKRIPDVLPEDGMWVPNDRGARMAAALRDGLGWDLVAEGATTLASPPDAPGEGLTFTATDADDGETRVRAQR